MRVERLDNGAFVVLKPRKDVSSVSVQFWLKTGAVFESDGNRGIAHFLEHMVFNGTRSFLPGEIEKIVENAGGEINAATSYDYTFYYITFPAKHVSLAVKLLKELVFFPVLSQEMVEKEKPIVLEEIARSENNPKTLLWREFLKHLYKKSNYRYPILGFKDTVTSFTDKTVKEFHQKHYHAGNLTVAISGNIDEDSLLTFIKDELKELPSGERNLFATVDDTAISKESFVLKHSAVANIHTVVGWRLPGLIQKQNVAPFILLESILSYGRSSILYQEITEKGFAFGVSAGFEEFLGGSSFYIYGITDSSRNGKFKEKLFSILDSFNSEEVFEFAKKKVLKSEIFKREAVESEAEEIGYSMTLLGNLELYGNLVERVKALSFEDFLRETAFLKTSPIIVELTPEDMEVVYDR